MSEVAPCTTRTPYTPRFRRGDVLFNSTDRNPNGEPTHKKLWVWDCHNESCSPAFTMGLSNDGRVLYMVKDGPGEKANVVGGWVKEEHLTRFPREEEPLIDL